jgi:hypothetical protein
MGGGWGHLSALLSVAGSFSMVDRFELDDSPLIICDCETAHIETGVNALF